MSDNNTDNTDETGTDLAIAGLFDNVSVPTSGVDALVARRTAMKKGEAEMHLVHSDFTQLFADLGADIASEMVAEGNRLDSDTLDRILHAEGNGTDLGIKLSKIDDDGRETATGTEDYIASADQINEIALAKKSFTKKILPSAEGQEKANECSEAFHAVGVVTSFRISATKDGGVQLKETTKIDQAKKEKLTDLRQFHQLLG
jgi:hypothetical protein